MNNAGQQLENGRKVAEGEGFEPPVTEYATTVFKTAALNRSATPPHYRLMLQLSLRDARQVVNSLK